MHDGTGRPANLKIPDGIRLIYLPPYTPELQPETLWALAGEPIIDQHIAAITELEEKIAAQCIAPAGQPSKSRAELVSIDSQNGSLRSN
jgi:hypothetical protein